jgi:hypothetical protein
MLPIFILFTPTAEEGRNSWPQMFPFWVVILVIRTPQKSTKNKNCNARRLDFEV